MRHGEGFHNIGIVNEDAHLTELGWRQAEALHTHVAALQPPLNLQVCGGQQTLSDKCPDPAWDIEA